MTALSNSRTNTGFSDSPPCARPIKHLGDSPVMARIDAGLKWPLPCSSDKHSLNSTAGPGVRWKHGIAHIENEGWLPGGITGDFVKQGCARSRFAQRPLMVHHFRGLVTGARSKAAG